MAPQDLPTPTSAKTAFLKTETSKILLALTLIMDIAYLLVLAFWFPRGNIILFSLLIAGEIFHLWMTLGYLYTVWDTEHLPDFSDDYTPLVDVFITVAGEPVEIVEATAKAAINMDYPRFNVYLLNDGKVLKKPAWREMETLANRLGISCVTRQVPGGAKAGNINNALKFSAAPLVAIFDADQVPHRDFLKKTVGYFYDPQMGFVQSPQFYKNHQDNEVTRGSWEQQELFFGPICKGKNRLNATFMCGTNMVIRKQALLSAGGMTETNIAEDFLTSLFIHKQGWKSVYVPEVLAEGLAPKDLLSYYNQQFRWARGSLEIIFKYNPLFMKGLSFGQKIQYLTSASYYLSGFVVVMNALLPLVFFYTGLMPLTISTMSLAAVFLPYILLTVLVLKLSSNFTYTFKALAFSMSSFYIQIKAAFGAILDRKTGFAVTSKKRLQGNFIHLATPHIAYIALAILGVEISIIKGGLSAALFSNLAWVLFNISAFIPFILASLPEPRLSKESTAQAKALSPQAINKIPSQISAQHFTVLDDSRETDILKRN